MYQLIIGIILLFISGTVGAQSEATLHIRSFREQSANRWLTEYRQFLEIPNIASDPTHLQDNASFICRMMADRGISNIQLLQPRTAGVPPVVYGEVMVPGATQTIIFTRTMMDNR